MLDITKDIQSLTTFRRRSGEFLKQLEKSKCSMVLTVNGKAAAIVHEAGAYQRLLDIAAQANAIEGTARIYDQSRPRRSGNFASVTGPRLRGVPRRVRSCQGKSQ